MAKRMYPFHYPHPIRGLLYDVRDWSRLNIRKLKYMLGLGPRPVCWRTHTKTSGKLSKETIMTDKPDREMLARGRIQAMKAIYEADARNERDALYKALISMTGWAQHLANEINRISPGGVSSNGPVSQDIKEAVEIIESRNDQP